MEIAKLAGSRTIVMFLLMMIGWVLFKTGKLTKQGSKDMANTLINVTLPVTIVQSFLTEYTAEKTRWILYSLGLSTACIGLSMLLSHLFFRKKPIDNAGVSFSNAGFIGLPLVQAILGSDAVIIAAPFAAVLNVLQSTYGVWVLDDKKSKIALREVIKGPIVLSAVIGMACYFLRISVPPIISSVISMTTGMNAPLAMLVLGVYLAQTEIKSLFIRADLYINSLVRLIVIPIATLVMLSFLPESLSVIKMTLMIIASAPVGANVAVYSQLRGLDYTYACKTVCLCTLLSVVTLPVMLMLAELF